MLERLPGMLPPNDRVITPFTGAVPSCPYGLSPFGIASVSSIYYRQPSAFWQRVVFVGVSAGLLLQAVFRPVIQGATVTVLAFSGVYGKFNNLSRSL